MARETNVEIKTGRDRERERDFWRIREREGERERQLDRREKKTAGEESQPG